MAIAPGTRFGPYEIVAPLGAGGMGEVYRAQDTRLGRAVAIKVLPENFAADPDRRARFEREAQAVAALSHPNIVAIHDTGVQEPTDSGPAQAFVVMELLAGQTLRERLREGALPVRKAVDIAVQVARGLGAAHSKGLVHRDLKPDNIFVLDDGQVKILDFGLARQTREASAHSGATRTVAVTDPGTVVGTIGYMAPEQVRGQTVDARADVFAFGAVLYEMVSGARAFDRETPADTMTAILTEDPPDLTGSRPDLSLALDRIVRHCLEKNPNERFQSARDIAFALEALSGSNASGTAAAAATGVPRRRMTLSPLLAGLLVILAAGGGIAGGRLLGTSAAASLKFTMKTFDPQAIFRARFMPDGATLVFSSALTGNVPSLFEIRQGTLEARRFGPDGTHLLAVSSKGELAVLTDARLLNQRLFEGTLARMTIEGAPRPWLDHVREADWSPDGETLAAIRYTGNTDVLEYPVGTRLYEVSGYLSDPRVSPDGARVAFMEHPQRFDDRGYVKVVDRSGSVTTLAGEFWGEEGLAWTPDGTAVLFSASRTSINGREPGELTYQVYRVAADGSGPAAFALTSPGDFVIQDVAASGAWLATGEAGQLGVVARGAGQAAERDLSWLNKSWGPNLSRDGERLLFADGQGGSEYAVVWRKIDGSPVVRLGDGDAVGWSPDGNWALGQFSSTGQLVVYPIGAGDPVRLSMSPVTHLEQPGWFPDSKHVVFRGSEPGKASRYYRQAVAGGAPEPILSDDVTRALFAPDGSMAVVQRADGTVAIYPLDNGQARPLGGMQTEDVPLAVSPDGRALFVTAGTQIPARVDRIDLATGARTALREFAPRDRAGLVRLTIDGPSLNADGTRYAYSYFKILSTLFVVTGTGSR